MHKRYRVTMTCEGRTELDRLNPQSRAAAQTPVHVRVSLLTDACASSACSGAHSGADHHGGLASRL